MKQLDRYEKEELLLLIAIVLLIGTIVFSLVSCQSVVVSVDSPSHKAIVVGRATAGGGE